MSCLRLSPEVQRLQRQAAYIDIYTDATVDPLRLPTAPKPEGWTRAGVYGARHIHDKAPFSLWDDTKRAFLILTKKQWEWTHKNFEAEGMGMQETYFWIATANPPKPIPLTLGCQPVLFVGVGEWPEIILPRAPYPNPRIPDPCPEISWPKLSNPTKQQSLAVLAALDGLGLLNMQGIIYMPYYTVVELVYGDGREYSYKSLPGKVAGRGTLYHHSPIHHFDTMKDLNRQRRLDPAAHNGEEAGPLPEDGENYLRRGGQLTPGNRVESGRGEHASPTTTAGVLLRHLHVLELLTVAHHGFEFSSEVWHPSAAETGDKIGDVVEIIPELDISLVQLTPCAPGIFTNRSYFQAETPVRLMEADDIVQGSWAEVDGMSSGLISLQAVGCASLAPIRTPGAPAIPFSKWRSFNINQIFGAINSRIAEGIRGAPTVSVDGGGV